MFMNKVPPRDPFPFGPIENPLTRGDVVRVVATGAAMIFFTTLGVLWIFG